MNIQLLERVILANNESCPDFTYKNPLLDKNVAKSLSKSFVKILDLSKHNSNINNNLRLSILDNIRKLCQIEPENHAKVDENLTELLTEFYTMHIKDSAANINTPEKDLEAFLIRKLKEVDISSTFSPTINPEVVQALINLNEHGVYLDTLSNDIIHWNSGSKTTCLVRDLWNEVNLGDKAVNDISIKMRPEIEKLLLETCYELIKNQITDKEKIFSSNAITKLAKSCAESPDCFQTCSSILNFIFVMTNFDMIVLNFISEFVKSVKNNCSYLSYSILYPMHLSSTVVILDIDIHSMPREFGDCYTQYSLKYLQDLQKTETDLIMLLSHFPQWFDIYFGQCEHTLKTSNSVMETPSF